MSGPAPAVGASIALTSNSADLTVPASVTVAADATKGSFNATASIVSSAQTVVINAALNGSSKAASLSLASPVTVTSLVCAPASLTSGTSSTCTVTASAAAPAGGVLIAINSNNALLTATASLTIPAGATNASFSATAHRIASGSAATVTATANGATANSTIALKAPVTVSNLACSPASVSGPGTSACTVKLSGPAPAGGASVALASNNANLTAPASVTVPAAATIASFNATVRTISSAQTALITAALNGSSQTSSLSLVLRVAVTSLTCAPTSLTSGGSSTCTVTASAAAPAGGLSVALSSNTTLLTAPPSVSVSPSATTVTFKVTASAISAAQTAVLTAMLNGFPTTASLALTTATTTACPCSVWKPDLVPALITSPDSVAVELGMKFSSKVAGYVLGVRFYKGPKNTGTHSGHLWTQGGTLLARVNFADETSSGWQEAIFSTPVAITANTTYIVSYWSPSSHFSQDVGYFSTSGVDNGPLHALKSGEAGTNGVYTYGLSSFPLTGGNSTNYWVDLVFNTVPSKNPTAAAPAGETNGSTTLASRSASNSRTAGALFCAPGAVHAGDSFTCELRLTPRRDAGATSIAAASSSSEVRLPAIINARAGQRTVQFVGTVDAAAAPSVLGIYAGNPGEQAEDRITVLASAAPVFSAPEKLLLKSGEPVSFRVSAQDPTGLPVQISATSLPAGASFRPLSNHFDWTPTPKQEGTHTLVFSEVNSAGLTSVNTLTMTVGSGKPVIAGSSQVACSPGSLATLNGTWLNLADQELSDPSGASQELGGTKVHVNAGLAPVLFASRTRVDFQCPNTAAGEGLDITLETAAGTTVAVHTSMLEASPKLLLAEGSHRNQGLITNSSANRLATTRDSLAGGEPAESGDLVSVRATGLGAAGSLNGLIFIRVGGVDAQIESVLPAPDAVGVFLITVRIPTAAPIGDTVPVQLEMISSTGRRLPSNTVTLAIE